MRRGPNTERHAACAASPTRVLAALVVLSALAVAAAAQTAPRKASPATQTYESLAAAAASEPVPGEWRPRPVLARSSDGRVLVVVDGKAYLADPSGSWVERGELAGTDAAVAATPAGPNGWRCLLRSGRVATSVDGAKTWAFDAAPGRASGLPAPWVVECGSLTADGGWAVVHGTASTQSAFVAVRDGEWVRAATVRGRATAGTSLGAEIYGVVGGDVYRVGETGDAVRLATLEGARLNGVAFVDDRRGWIAASKGLVIETRDGGASWLSRPAAPGADLEAIGFRTPSLGWAVGRADGHGVLYVTADGGVTWRMAFGAPGGLSTPALEPGGRAWLVDDDGRVWSADDLTAEWRRMGSLGKSKKADAPRK